MYIAARARHAAARLRRRAHDARAAGARLRRRQGYLPPRPLRPDLHGARHDHDLLRGHAVRDRADELRRAAADRRARRRLPVPELVQLLADRRRARCWSTSRCSSANSPAPAGWPIRRCRSSRYSPGVGVDYYLWALQIAGVGTLLSGINLITTILKMRAPGMSYDAHAGLLLDGAGHQPADRRRLPDPDRDARACCCSTATSAPTSSPTTSAATPMMYVNLIWAWGHPGGLHPGPAGLRHLLRGDRDLLRQAAVRLPLDGLRHAWRSASCRSWSGCTTSSPWARAPTSTPSSASRR